MKYRLILSLFIICQFAVASDEVPLNFSWTPDVVLLGDDSVFSWHVENTNKDSRTCTIEYSGPGVQWTYNTGANGTQLLGANSLQTGSYQANASCIAPDGSRMPADPTKNFTANLTVLATPDCENIPELELDEVNNQLSWCSIPDAAYYKILPTFCRFNCGLDYNWHFDNVITTTETTFDLSSLASERNFTFRVTSCDSQDVCHATGTTYARGWSNTLNYSNVSTELKVETYQWQPAVILKGQETAFHWQVKNATQCNLWLLDGIADSIDMQSGAGTLPSRTDIPPGEHRLNGYCFNDALDTIPENVGIPHSQTEYLIAKIKVLEQPDNIHIPLLAISEEQNWLQWPKLSNVNHYKLQQTTCISDCATATANWSGEEQIIPGGSFVAAITNVEAGKHYAFRIAACSTALDSSCYGWSNIATMSKVNTPPRISPISEQNIANNSEFGRLINFSVNDNETLPAALTVNVSSNNPELIPASGIETGIYDHQTEFEFNGETGGIGFLRWLRLTPQENSTGKAEITLTVSDGALTSQLSFNVLVGEEINGIIIHTELMGVPVIN